MRVKVSWMTNQTNQWIVSLVRPPLMVLGFIAKAVYSLFLGRADKRLAQKTQEVLAASVKAELPFLFNEFGGVIIPNEGVPFPPGFDYAIVTVEVGELLFRFIRGRGDLDVRVAAASAATDWRDVTLVISAIEDPEDMKRKSFLSLSDFAPLLRRNMCRLVEAFSSAQYAETRQHLAKFDTYERVVTKQTQTEINRRLYS
jgi:hypothetical protein